MNDERVVLVTGVGDYWGRRLAAHLMSEPGLRVIGLDARPPVEKVPGLDFIQADIRNPVLAELLRDERVQVCCHLKFDDAVRPGDRRSDINIMGAMNVIGACLQSGVQQLVLKSSTTVYGAFPDNTAFLTEGAPLRGSLRDGAIHDLLEIESLSASYRDGEGGTDFTVLRFANIVGPTANTPMTRFLSLPAAPVLLGFDPLLQFVHEEDVLAAMVQAVVTAAGGVYNIAAEDPLPLSRALRLAGTRSLPLFHPLAYHAAARLRGAADRARWTPFEWDYLRYSWTADLTGMGEQLAFTPQHTAAEALQELSGRYRAAADGQQQDGPPYNEQRLRDIMDQRRQARERAEESNIAATGDNS